MHVLLLGLGNFKLFLGSRILMSCDIRLYESCILHVFNSLNVSLAKSGFQKII